MLSRLVTGNDYMRSNSARGYDYVEIKGATLLPLEASLRSEPLGQLDVCADLPPGAPAYVGAAAALSARRSGVESA